MGRIRRTFGHCWAGFIWRCKTEYRSVLQQRAQASQLFAVQGGQQIGL